MAEYPQYSLARQPTDTEVNEVWAYIRAVSGGTCDGRWYEPSLDSWVFVRGYFYRSDPEHRARLQSSIYIRQRFFASCRDHRMTVAQGLENAHLAEKIREALPWSSYLTISDVDPPIAMMHIGN